MAKQKKKNESGLKPISKRNTNNVGTRKTKVEAMRQFYDKLLRASEIPIIETADIHSKGLYLREPVYKESRADKDAGYEETHSKATHNKSTHLKSTSTNEVHVKKTIYIKESLNTKEKLKVLLHEYSHHVHLTHYFKDETRAECEMIANGSGFLVAAEFGLNILKDVDLTGFTDDVDTATRLRVAIQSVGKHILAGIRGLIEGA